MTYFERLAKRLDVLEMDENGFYIKKCKALYDISIEIFLSDDENIIKLSDKEKEKIIEERFYELFPYMKK